MPAACLRTTQMEASGDRKGQLTRKLRVAKALNKYQVAIVRAEKEAAPKSHLQIAQVLLGLLGGLGSLVLAGFGRDRVVDLADVVGLDRKRLVLYAVSHVRLGLDLAVNNHQRPSLDGGGGLRERSPNLNLEPIGVLVLGVATVFPCARRSSPSGGPNQVWREATAHQRVGRRAKTATARSWAPSRCVAPFFASSVGSSRRRNCGRSRSDRHGCPHSRRIYAAQIDDFFCPSFKGWSAAEECADYRNRSPAQDHFLSSCFSGSETVCRLH
jgi:hypothetical protein